LDEGAILFQIGTEYTDKESLWGYQRATENSRLEIIHHPPFLKIPAGIPWNFE